MGEQRHWWMMLVASPESIVDTAILLPFMTDYLYDGVSYTTGMRS